MCSLLAFVPSEHKTTNYLNEHSGNKPQNPLDFTHNKLPPFLYILHMRNMFIISLLILNSSSHSQWLLKFKGNVLSEKIVSRFLSLTSMPQWDSCDKNQTRRGPQLPKATCLWSRRFPELWYAARTNDAGIYRPQAWCQHSTRGLGKVSGTTAAPLNPHSPHPTNYMHLLLL